MDRTFTIYWAVLCASILIFEIVSSTLHDDSNQRNMRNQRGNEITKPYLWFGPRLGRKKRNSNQEIYENPRYTLATLMDAIGNTPWAIVPMNEGKRHVVNFTPRLGRESGEELEDCVVNKDWWLQHPICREELSERSPPFAPRLGRHVSSFYSRVGSENDKMLPS